LRIGKRPKKLYQPKTRTIRDEIRAIYKENDILDQLPPLRNTPTHLERALTRRGITASLANVLTPEEALDFLAAESGLEGGITSATRPERLTFAWLKSHGYTYGGTGGSADTTADFVWQYPLNGGKNVKGGTEVDFFLSGKATGTPKGTTLFIDGLYAHSRPGIPQRDRAEELVLQAKGFVVQRITDVETDQSGVLDQRMRSIMLPK
jgi:hypothetical protein